MAERQEFDRELDAIESNVIQLFGMVGEDLSEATTALLAGDNRAFTVLTERDQEIDALYREVETTGSREILLQAPVASDLRFLLSVLRVVPELERSHDLVVQIAEKASHALVEDLTPRVSGLIASMGEVAAVMWREAADSWYKRDRAAAPLIAGRDEQMDELHASLIAELASGRVAVPVAMELTLVARCYKRLGAHAVNIARRVIYLAGQPRTEPPGG